MTDRQADAPALHMICGKIAAGKSTLAARLGAAPGTVLLAEDDWLSALFPGELRSLEDYADRSRRLRQVMAAHVAALLRAGVSVVLDFPANTPRQRAWMRETAEAAGAAHRLHLLAPPDEVCLERLRARNAAGEHPFAVTEDQFRQFSAHFAPPGPEEGFTVVEHPVEG